MPNEIGAKLTINTAEGIANVKQLGDVTDAQMKRMARATELLARQTAAQTRAIKEQTALQKAADAGVNTGGRSAAAAAATEAVDAIQKATKATHEFSLSTASAQRELLVLFHEGLTGNFKRMAGSFSVLISRANAMGAVISALTNPFTIAAAAAAAMGASVISRENELTQLTNAITLTGNAAGLTASQFDHMADLISTGGATSIGKARDAIMELARSGSVGAANIEKMGLVAVKVSQLSGKSVQDVAAEFVKAGKDVATFAKEHADSWGSVSASQYQAIVSAQKLGDTQGALAIYLDAMNKRLPATTTLLGALGAAFSDANAGLQRFLDPSNGQKLEDLDAKINSIFKRMAVARAEAAKGSGNPVAAAAEDPVLREQLRQLTTQRNALAALEGAANGKAQNQAKAELQHKEATAAVDFINRLKDEGKAASTLKEELDRLAESRAKVEADGGKVSDADYDAAVKGVHRKYDDRSGKKVEGAYESTEKTLRDDQARMQAQIDGYKQYGRAVDETRVAVLKLRESEGGDLANLSPAKKSQLNAYAGTADSTAAALKNAETEASVKRMVDAYADLNKAKETDAKTAFINQALDANGLSIDKQVTQNLVVMAAALRNSAAARFDNQQAHENSAEMTKRQVAVDQEIAGITRENDALHQNALQRATATDVAKLQRMAEEDLAKPYADAILIQAQLAENLKKVTAAREAQYRDARNPNTAAGAAGSNWIDNATNGGAAAAGMTTSTLNGISSAIQHFAETGKLNFKTLWKTMADEFLSNVIRMQVAKLAGGTSSLFGGLFSLFNAGTSGGQAGSLGNGGAGDYSSAGLAAAFAGLSGARADGGNINAGGTYLVGERGPELFKSSGSGSIVPNEELDGGSNGQVIHVGQGQVINVGQGVSRAEVHAAVSQANAQTIKQVQRLSSTGKLRS